MTGRSTNKVRLLTLNKFSFSYVTFSGMSDRVVDECNPDAHLTMKDVSTLCWDDKKDEGEEKDWAHVRDNYIDVVLQKVLEKHGRALNKEPFQHESLLVDRKEKQLSSQEKRLAKKGKSCIP